MSCSNQTSTTIYIYIYIYIYTYIYEHIAIVSIIIVSACLWLCYHQLCFCYICRFEQYQQLSILSSHALCNLVGAARLPCALRCLQHEGGLWTICPKMFDTSVFKKTLLRIRIPLEVWVLKTPNQGVESSFCRCFAGRRLAKKEWLFTYTGRVRCPAWHSPGVANQ